MSESYDVCESCDAQFVHLRFPKPTVDKRTGKLDGFRIPSNYKGFACGYCKSFVDAGDVGGFRGDWTWKQLQRGLGNSEAEA